MAARQATPYGQDAKRPQQEWTLERLQYRTVGAPESLSTGTMAPATPFPALQPQANQTGAAAQAEPATAVEPVESEWMRRAATLENMLEEQKAATLLAIAAAREEARNQERAALDERLAAQIEQQRIQIAACVEAFQAERQRYFDRLEREVVRLSLAIAGRILHREAQLDPLFLSGAVRVALDKLNESSGVVVRVAPPEAMLWRTWFRTPGNARIQPSVMEDPSLNLRECVLETQLGTIELGMRAQLEEIEKGFFDLLDHRPAGARDNHSTVERRLGEISST